MELSFLPAPSSRTTKSYYNTNMAQSTALRRLRKEYADLRKDPVFPGILVEPLETNFLHAHFLLSGVVFHDTPYEGGVYHGVLKFPPMYPLKPPSVIMRTPSGRFQPDVKICYSFSDFHPELWNPMWSIRTILTGLVSFMNTEEITTGGLTATAAHRVETAKSSLRHCLENDKIAKDLFGKQLVEISEQRRNMGDSWPPPRLATAEGSPPTNVASVTAPIGSTRRGQPTTKNNESNDKVDDTKSNQSTEASSSKSAAKNKKKREKEKRRKLVQNFVEHLRTRVPEFLETVVERLGAKGVDVTNCTPDHVCWRTETVEEYNNLVSALRASEQQCTLLMESEVGGRSIATFRLHEGIQVLDAKHSISVVEIPAPKDGRPYSSGLEHVEFVIPPSTTAEPSAVNDAAHTGHLQRWMDQHATASLEWNTKALSKRINPDVSLAIGESCRVKFHLVPLDKVIEDEKEGNLLLQSDQDEC